MSDILEPVLTTILLDMINAQNQANIRSAQLALEYTSGDKEAGLLEFFDVPSAIIKSFDFELKFGLESAGSPIAGEMGNKLSALIERALNGFVQQCMKNYQLPVGSEEQLKHLIAALWKGEGGKAAPRLGFEPAPKLMDDANDFMATLKREIKALTDSELFLDPEERTQGLKAVLNVSDLNSYNGDVLCAINVNVEFAGMKAGFMETFTKEGEPKEPARKIFLMRA